MEYKNERSKNYRERNQHEINGDIHVMTSVETPLKKDAFVKSDQEKIENSYQYNKMLVGKGISFSSACEHHFLPIVGQAHIGYISSGKVIGLSKLNRIVEYYGRRPQVQERMTLQIFNELRHALQTDDVIVVVEAEHLCVSTRGVNDRTSRTTTIEYGGKFDDGQLRNEFHRLVAPGMTSD